MTNPKTAAELRERPAGQTPKQQFAAVLAARQQRCDAQGALLDTAGIEGRELRADEQRSFDRDDDEIRRLDVLARVLEADDPAVNAVDRTGLKIQGAGDQTKYREGAPLGAGQSFVGYARATGQIPDDDEGMSLSKALRGVVTGDWGGAAREIKAMSEGALAGGGYLVPTVLSTEIIDMARNTGAVTRAGARLFPMINRTVDVAKWTGDPTPAWHSENALIVPSEGMMSKITLVAKTLPCLTVVSRELLEDAAQVEVELRRSFAMQFALTTDKAALYGSGTPPEPLGVKNTAGVTKTPLGGVNGSTPANWDWLLDADGRLSDSNEEANAVIYSPRTARTMAKLKNTQNDPMRTPDALADIERFDTNQCANTFTVGTSTTTSDAFVADWSQLYLGLRTKLEIQVLTERYADYGQVGFLCWWRGDVQVARPAAFDVTTGLLP